MKQTIQQSDRRLASADHSHRTLRQIQKDPNPSRRTHRVPLAWQRGPSTLPLMSDQELEEAKRQLRKFRPDHLI